MRRRLGPEVRRQAEDSARGIAGLIIRQGAGEVKQIGKDPSSRSLTSPETTSAPAQGSYRDLSRKPLVPGTLALFNRSSGAEYVAGFAGEASDFEEDAGGGRFRNLTIPSGTSLDAYYHYYQTAGGGVTDHGALTGLGPEHDDHALYAPAEGPDRTITDARIGDRTVDQSLSSEAADTGRLTALLSWIAGRLRAVTGEADWKTAPAATLKDAAAHAADTNNPHGTTAAQVSAVPLSQRGAANGVATLGADSKIPSSQLSPLAISDTFVVNNQSAMLSLTAQVGDVAVRTDQSRSYILRDEPASTLGNWQEFLTPQDAVVSVNNKTGAVSLSANDVGAALDPHAHDQYLDRSGDSMDPGSTLGLAGDGQFEPHPTADGIAYRVDVNPTSGGKLFSVLSSGGASRFSVRHAGGPLGNNDVPLLQQGDAAPADHVGSGGNAHAAATSGTAGFQAAADKAKLDGIEAGATADLTFKEIKDLLAQNADFSVGNANGYKLKVSVNPFDQAVLSLRDATNNILGVFLFHADGGFEARANNTGSNRNAAIKVEANGDLWSNGTKLTDSGR